MLDLLSAESLSLMLFLLPFLQLFFILLLCVAKDAIPQPARIAVHYVNGLSAIGASTSLRSYSLTLLWRR
jgi:hypothetical protein